MKVKNEIESRVFTTGPLKIEKRDGEDSKIVGHAAVFDQLSGNLGGFQEKIDRRAFDSVLTDDVRALFNHDANMVLGRVSAGTLKISTDDTGLRYEITPPDTQLARDLMVSIERGDIRESSFAFVVNKQDWGKGENGQMVRSIQSFKKLIDVSLVTYPAYPDASVGLRSLQQWKDDNSSDDKQKEEQKIAAQQRDLQLQIAESVCSA